MKKTDLNFGNEKHLLIVENKPNEAQILSNLALPHGPIETAMRAKLQTLNDTKYPDTFDWGVYDKIAARFDEEPRGGVVFKTGLKLVNYHSSCSKCHYAF